MRNRLHLLGVVAIATWMGMIYAAGCSANSSESEFGGGVGGSGGAFIPDAPGGDGQMFGCNACLGTKYTVCDENGKEIDHKECAPQICAPGVGCVECQPNKNMCVGNEVHACTAEGKPGDLIETCDTGAGKLCGDGKCGSECELVSGQPSNVGCEFWAVDLDQQDAMNDPASAPWGVVLSNASQAQANVTIEINDAAVGETPVPTVVTQVSVGPGDLKQIVLPTRELDCGTKPNDYKSPGTCLSSRAFRITSSAPIVVYQFNVFTNTYSNDASLLLPTNALGKIHRVIGWVAGHPFPTNFPGIGTIIDRSYVTVVGTKENTLVKVRPSWRIRGNPPIAATGPGESIDITIGPFDVLNLETDDALMKEDMKVATDLTGTIVESTQPVAVFSGVESTQSPAGFEIPTYPGWGTGDTCCLDHLEEQIFPVESVGMHYVITRSPIRSTSSWREPDVIRFLGVAEDAEVKTTLPPPYDSFTIQPGEVITTWAQNDFVVESSKPVMVGQILISNGYVEGAVIGDPSLTIYPPVEQYRTEYVILTPNSWDKNYVVISVEVGTDVQLDGSATTGCTTESAGTVLGIQYESRRCPLNEGVHHLSGAKPFGIVAYGYGSAGSYAFAGGADVKKIYNPPPLK
ncbi:MAG: IgGFc-binding protein [Deltaproteobacteria bacterium]|nr:IgGFc-binding protein [Deltaproteobacteria bacterium]